MERNERSRHTQRRNEKNLYKRLIEAGRDTLSEWQMEILLTLYEQPTKERAAEILDTTVDSIDFELAAMVKWRESTERHTKDGRPYKKRLTRAAIIGILAERTDLDEAEQDMIRALIDAPNQVVAAKSLNMSFGDFQKRFVKMRRDRDF